MATVTMHSSGTPAPHEKVEHQGLAFDGDGAPSCGVVHRYPGVVGTPADDSELRMLANGVKAVAAGFSSVVKSLGDCSFKVVDGVIGLTAMRGAAVAPPLGIGAGVLFGARSAYSLTDSASCVKEGVKAIGRFLVDPSFEALASIAEKSVELTKLGISAAYVGAMVGACSFNPVLHGVSLLATGTCAFLGGVADLSSYATALQAKRQAHRSGDNYAVNEFLRDQVIALLNIAEKVALVAFAVISLYAAPYSMIATTFATGATVVAAATFGLLAKMYTEFYQTPFMKEARVLAA